MEQGSSQEGMDLDICATTIRRTRRHPAPRTLHQDGGTTMVPRCTTWRRRPRRERERGSGVVVAKPVVLRRLRPDDRLRYPVHDVLDRHEGAVAAVLAQLLEQHHRLRVHRLQRRAG